MFRRVPAHVPTLLALGLAVLLIACGGGTPTASLSPSTGVATPSPSASPSVPVLASTAPSASPAGETGGPLAEAFVAKMDSDDLTTHLNQVAEATVDSARGEVTVTVEMDGDLSGSDFAFTLNISSAGVDVRQELVLLGDTAYVTQEGGSWSTAPRDALGETAEGLLDNLRVVKDPDDLRYVGPDTLDGRPVHRLTAAGRIAYNPSTGGTGEYERLDVWVEEDGTPVRVEGEFTAVDGAGNEGSGTTRLTFSNFGEPVEIVAPSIEPAAS